LREDLKSIVASPHDASSIVGLAEAVSALSEELNDLKKRIEVLEKEEKTERRRSQSLKKSGSK